MPVPPAAFWGKGDGGWRSVGPCYVIGRSWAKAWWLQHRDVPGLFHRAGRWCGLGEGRGWAERGFNPGAGSGFALRFGGLHLGSL
jgi:hypothetical protein